MADNDTYTLLRRRLNSLIYIINKIIYINKLNTLTLIYDTIIKNNNFKIILKVQ
jgi:hypothetical protein